jgi:hypothetical protein
MIDLYVAELVNSTRLVFQRADMAQNNSCLSIKPKGVIHSPDPHGEVSWPHMPFALNRSSIDSPTASSGNLLEGGFIEFQRAKQKIARIDERSNFGR